MLRTLMVAGRFAASLAIAGEDELDIKGCQTFGIV